MRTGPRTQPPDELVAFCAAEYPRVLGTLRLLTREDRLAEDLAQECFVRLCRDWEKVARLDRPSAWIHRVAMNLAFSAFRRRGTERRAWSQISDGIEPAIDQHRRSAPPDEREAVRRALGTLDERARAVVVLRFFADLSVRETGAALDMAEGTVKTITKRALESLRSTGLIQEVAVHD